MFNSDLKDKQEFPGERGAGRREESLPDAGSKVKEPQPPEDVGIASRARCENHCPLGGHRRPTPGQPLPTLSPHTWLHTSPEEVVH